MSASVYAYIHEDEILSVRGESSNVTRDAWLTLSFKGLDLNFFFPISRIAEVKQAIDTALDQLLDEQERKAYDEAAEAGV